MSEVEVVVAAIADIGVRVKVAARIVEISAVDEEGIKE